MEAFTVVVFDAGMLVHLRNFDVSAVVKYAKGKQDPDNDANHDDGVDNRFDLSVHRNIGVDEPEQYADDNQGENERNQRHRAPSVGMSILLFMH
jgi:hypothetical protein